MDDDSLGTIKLLISNLSTTLDKLDDRMSRLETLREQDIQQNERITQIFTRLQQGNVKFEEISHRLEVIDGRIGALEKNDGQKAKDLVGQVKGLLIAAVVGAIISSLPALIKGLIN